MKLFQLFAMAFQSLKTNRLRTMLTILGVVVGIFSIIVIMTIITMLQNTIEEGVSFLSKNTFMIQKWPAVNEGDSWEKYRNRRDITLEEFYRLQKLLKEAKYVTAEQGSGGKVIQFRNRKTNPNIYVIGVTGQAIYTHNLDIEDGRELRDGDVEFSRNVCMLGRDVVEKLFYDISPIGQEVRIDGRPYTVVGTIKKRPDFFGQSQDTYAVIPLTSFQATYGKRSESIDITVMSHSQADYASLMESATGYMRTIRKVEPGKDNDFDVFSNESIMGQINGMTSGIRIGALAVSLIALLAAGVGIMNIMLVSVTERTREIGIRKAIGAKKKNILMQFLIEAVALCLTGGLIGIAIGIGVGNLAGSYLHATVAVPVDWIIIGLSMCLCIGIIFGTYPAYKAANLDPIEALRYD
jgi:putative ABC transport system permease protein